MTINIVLLEPEIPQNTGNIARTCAATGSKLHLIEPLGFLVNDKYLKRSGLDYWDDVDITYYKNFEEFSKCHVNKTFYFASTKAQNTYADIIYPDDVFIIFGRESAGIPEEILKNNKEKCIRIPMKENKRSLNLSNSVAIITFEILRQNGFKNFIKEGCLTKFNWSEIDDK